MISHLFKSHACYGFYIRVRWSSEKIVVRRKLPRSKESLKHVYVQEPIYGIASPPVVLVYSLIIIIIIVVVVVVFKIFVITDFQQYVVLCGLIINKDDDDNDEKEERLTELITLCHDPGPGKQ